MYGTRPLCITRIVQFLLVLAGMVPALQGNAQDAGSNGSAVLCGSNAPVQLFAYLGGTPDNTGTWSGPAAHPGTFDPATDPPGVYTYTVPGPPVASATVTVSVTAPANAGTSSTFTTCSNGAPVDLFTQLGGQPEAGGAWTFNAAPVSNMYTPGTSAPGEYKYSVSGSTPCPADSAIVTVASVAAPDAGVSRSITVCSSDAPFSMRGQLSGTPQTGGVWSPGASDTFTPGTSLPGNYSYMVSGASPCANDIAVLSVSVNQAPVAGAGGALEVCGNGPIVDLFTRLTGGPDVGGTWSGPSGPHSGQIQPATDASGPYVYTVAGLAPCASATATMNVTVRPAPNAGTSNSIVKCSKEPAFSLISQLLGSPASGGTWEGPDGAAFPSGTFDPAVSLPGLYTYTVQGLSPCDPAVATVNVSIVTAPNAGVGGTISVCASGGSFALTDILDGQPDAGGTWSGPSAVPGGVFTPGVNGSGDYTYTVAGSAPCANATATVTVTVVAPANAGSNGSVTLCNTGPTENLFGRLGGTPDAGGTWSKPAGGGVLAGGLYNPADPAHPAGTYVYTVNGASPCPNVSATVQVVENQAPNAGVNGSTTVCSTGSSFDLGTVLGGQPDAGGSWLNSASTVVPPTFQPGTTAAGVYRYVLNASAPCVNDTGFATVVVVTAPNAGLNGTTTVCSDQPEVVLATLLGGTPGTGTWTDPDNQPHSGTYVPGPSAVPGAYTFTVPGQSPCVNATSTVTVTQHRRPVAGLNGTLSLCSTASAADLFLSLGGTPDAGGVWKDPGGGMSSGIFTPTTPGTFIYTYKVSGIAPCGADSATVSVTVSQAPNAGISGALTICSGQASVDLFTGLGGTPDLTGTWSELTISGRLSNHFFNPSTPTQLPPGSYQFKYIVPAAGLCPAAEAMVDVTIVPILDAGTNGTITACGNNTSVDLFTGLAGTPQAGGIWTDLNGTGLLFGQYFNASGATGAGPFNFRYKLSGTIGCSADSAQVAVNVLAAPNAGVSGSVTFCSDGTPVGLLPYLGNTAQIGGTWRKPAPGSQVFSGAYEPATFDPGIYTYTVGGTPPCADAVATLLISESTAPDPGVSAVRTVCSSDAPFDMRAQLGGAPAPNGTWQAPDNTPHGNTFNPQLDPPGVYVHTVTGIFPCANKNSSLTVNVNPAAYAGADATTTVCSNGTAFPLFNLLSASGAQSGGTWFDPGDAPFPSGTFQPGTSVPGAYTYRVTGQTPCAMDEATVTVFEVPKANAGTSASATLCANGPAVPLIDLLGGTPDPTGTWTGPAPGNGYFSGTFVPGATAPGVYTYLVNGIPPCGNATSTVTVAIVPPPNAGSSRNITVCSAPIPFVMFDSLGGSPATNGTWTMLPGNTPSNGIFTPGTAGTFSFRYTVGGAGPCGAAQSTLTITVNPAPKAGTNGSLAVCSNSGTVPLFPALGGTPQTGGTWSFNGPHGGTFNPTADVAGNYVYTVSGLAPCPSSTATVSVTLNQAPNAGSNGVLIICDSDPTPIVLRNVLNGSPGMGGSWTLNGNPVSDIYLPGTYTPGSRTFTYTIPGQSPCNAATAQATIIQYGHPAAGNDAAVALCTNDASVNLLTVLGGSPDNTGNWINASNGFVPAVFDPGSHTAGTYVYRYIVSGTSPCVNDTARVTITLNRKPEAGISTAPVICSDGSSVSLLELLGGNPDSNGSWTYHPTGGAPVPHGPVFDPQTDGAGAYIYIVPGVSPCGNATATVQIGLSTAPDAGTYATATVCATENAFLLFNALNGTPQPGGSWTAINSTGHLSNGVFDPTGLPSGTYGFRYTVTGSAACGTDTASVQVTVAPALNAGTDASVTLCASQVVFLTPLLGGSPQSGGVWTGVENATGLVNGVLNAGAAGEGLHHYRYVLASGSANCEPDTAILTITVMNGPQAGSDGSISVCSNGTSINLFSLLGEPHDLNGTWYSPAPGGPLGGSTVDPATGPAGAYRYIVPAIGGCPADTAFATVTIQQAVSAGSDGNLAFCSNGAPLNLGTALGGSPAANGTWTLGNNGPVHGPVYDPAVDAPGNYVYTVLGQSPCGNASASVFVTETPQPVAGNDNSYTFCSAQGQFNMVQKLAGSPQTTGSWQRVGPPNTPHGPTYNPIVDSSGVFLYIVGGAGPCISDSAFLTVNEVRAPRAGNSVTLQACPSDTAVDLFAALGTSADSIGTWTDADGQPVDSLFNAQASGIGSYVFTYTVPGTSPCTEAVAEVTVVVASTLSAGIGGQDTICGGDSAYDLFLSLTGSPDTGGIWTVVTGGNAVNGHFLDAASLPSGEYPLVYTVEDPGCGPVQSTVELFIAPFPDPGADSTVVRCFNEATFPLFSGLAGSPEPGGSWTGPNGPVPSGLFDPATDPQGDYVYRLAGNDYCGDTSATVTVVVNLPANAGTSVSERLCGNGDIALFPLLGGEPQPGGVWTDLSGSGALGNDTVQATLLTPGTYLFQYGLSIPGCTQDTALVTLIIVDAPQVSNVQTSCDPRDRTYTVTFTITGGDAGHYSVSGGPGTLSEQAPYVFTSAPYFANQPYAFTVDDPDHCGAATVSGVPPCPFVDDVFVPGSFTPNGDGVNDKLEIPGIGAYPANKIAIFNRWGAEVYSATGYDNKDTVWDGSSPQALIPGDCPTGTYYYVLELGDGKDDIKGFIYLNR